MVHHVYNVVRGPNGWAVEHGDKVLEVFASHEAALAHVDGLRKLTQSGGHDAEVITHGADGGVESDKVYKAVKR